VPAPSSLIQRLQVPYDAEFGRTDFYTFSDQSYRRSPQCSSDYSSWNVTHGLATSTDIDSALTLTVTKTAELGCCLNCYMKYYSVEVMYFPASNANYSCLSTATSTLATGNATAPGTSPATTTPAASLDARDGEPISTLVGSDGFTYTSPSVYVVFSTIEAVNLCGFVGKQFTDVTMAFDPGELYLTNGRSGGTTRYEASYLPCPPQSILDWDFYNAMGESTWQPYIAQPARLTELDPSFASCSALWLQGEDPPVALTRVEGGLPPNTKTTAPQPPKVTADPETSKPTSAVPADKPDSPTPTPTPQQTTRDPAPVKPTRSNEPPAGTSADQPVSQTVLPPDSDPATERPQHGQPPETPTKPEQPAPEEPQSTPQPLQSNTPQQPEQQPGPEKPSQGSPSDRPSTQPETDPQQADPSPDIPAQQQETVTRPPQVLTPVHASASTPAFVVGSHTVDADKPLVTFSDGRVFSLSLPPSSQKAPAAAQATAGQTQVGGEGGDQPAQQGQSSGQPDAPKLPVPEDAGDTPANADSADPSNPSTDNISPTKEAPHAGSNPSEPTPALIFVSSVSLPGPSISVLPSSAGIIVASGSSSKTVHRGDPITLPAAAGGKPVVGLLSVSEGKDTTKVFVEGFSTTVPYQLAQATRTGGEDGRGGRSGRIGGDGEDGQDGDAGWYVLSGMGGKPTGSKSVADAGATSNGGIEDAATATIGPGGADGAGNQSSSRPDSIQGLTVPTAGATSYRASVLMIGVAGILSSVVFW
jgi:hypothetical protein